MESAEMLIYKTNDFLERWFREPSKISSLTDLFAHLIEDHDAAVRKECADRAVEWAKKWAEFPMGNHGTEALRAAIMGDKHD